MTALRTAAQQALEACEQRLPLKGQAAIIDELNNLRAALAQQAEPVLLEDRVIELQQARARDNIAFKQLLAQRDALLEALKKADQFITNGIELGFIRMPDAETPDSAHETPGIVRAAIKAVEEGK